MISSSDSKANDNNQGFTLQQLVAVVAKVLPNQADVLQLMVSDTNISSKVFSGFVLDSRQLNSDLSTTIQPAFVLLKSHTQPIEKSQQYAKSASQHAAFIISEIGSKQLAYEQHSDEFACPILFVENIRSVLGSLIQMSLIPQASWSGYSSPNTLADALPEVVAVTGTNGKTTISQLVAQLCQFSNVSNLQNSAVMGTAGNGRLDSLVQATHTTGDALAVQRFLRQMADDGVELLALEASSHGLDQQRLQGVPVKVAVYSNLSRDHLDYHPDMQDYARAKARLFDTTYFPQLTHAIINLDDEFASHMMEAAAASGIDVWTYSLRADSTASFVATQITPSLDGVQIHLVSDFGTVTLDSPLLGHFNVANLLAAIAAVMALGVALDDIPNLVSQLHGASGRMQRITLDNATGDVNNTSGCFIVDYAHTPDALTQVLTSLKPHCEGDLWAVFGCGGNRDTGKRPLMAQAGLAVADKVILTSDNPRNEDPIVILQDMQQGMTQAQQHKTEIIADRRKAIEYAVQHAKANDIVVIAGKGHETYQEIKGVRHDFDDREVLKQALSVANTI